MNPDTYYTGYEVGNVVGTMFAIIQKVYSF